MKVRHLKSFPQHTNYEEYRGGGKINWPHVAYCIKENEVHYDTSPYGIKYLFKPEDTFTKTATGLSITPKVLPTLQYEGFSFSNVPYQLQINNDFSYVNENNIWKLKIKNIQTKWLFRLTEIEGYREYDINVQVDIFSDENLTDWMSNRLNEVAFYHYQSRYDGSEDDNYTYYFRQLKKINDNNYRYTFTPFCEDMHGSYFMTEYDLSYANSNKPSNLQFKISFYINHTG